MFNECAPSEDGLTRQGVSNLKQKLIRRLQDDFKLSGGNYEEI
jgi:hypothetical protein